MPRVQLDTGCEGPLALNDNAFELCRDFLSPAGDRFFTQVSRYDDYLADVLKKPGYKAGDTLKLILPFLKAAGLTNARIRDYSVKTVKLMPGAAEGWRRLQAAVAAAPDIELPPGAASLADLPGPVQEAIGRCDQIFFEKIPAMEIGVLYREVNPLAGSEKARALTDSLAKTSFTPA